VRPHSPTSTTRDIDARRGPIRKKFVDALTTGGLARRADSAGVTAAPGLGLAEASVIMEEVNRSWQAMPAPANGQMYNMGTLLRHGSAEQKAFYLPRIASGEWRLQSMGVT